MRQPVLSELGIRLAIDIALQEAMMLSRESPHHIFWLHAVKCPGCRKHAIALAITCNVEGPRPKYVLATVMNGQIVPRNSRRH